MNKLSKLTQQRKLAHTKLLKLKSKVYKAFIDMEQATFRRNQGGHCLKLAIATIRKLASNAQETLPCFGVQFEAECRDDFENRVKARNPLS